MDVVSHLNWISVYSNTVCSYYLVFCYFNIFTTEGIDGLVKKSNELFFVFVCVSNFFRNAHPNGRYVALFAVRNW